MSTKQVAERLGLTVGRVRQLAMDGTLKGERVGRDWVFLRDDVEDYASRPRDGRGRPRTGEQ